jgi:hypothetical protein
VAAVIITMRVSIPFDDAIKAAGVSDPIDLASIRDRFMDNRQVGQVKPLPASSRQPAQSVSW